jgi:hypothetical protein
MAALDDLPRPGKEPTITAEAKASAQATIFDRLRGLTSMILMGTGDLAALSEDR